MKKLLLLVSMLTSFGANAQTASNKSANFDKLIGKWVINSDDGTPAYLEIIDSANILLTYQGETRKCENTKMNFDKSPYWFDFTSKDGDSAIHVKTILEVFDNDVAKWQLFVDEERTPHFTATKGEILYLKKAKGAITVAAKQ